MLTWLADRIARCSERPPWTDAYGVARTLLALGSLVTLIGSSGGTLFNGRMQTEVRACTADGRLSLFCLVPPAHYEAARWVAIALLAVVASGWRPRVTGVIHWWISFSLFLSIVPLDGGDQITAILCLLLVPVTITDRRAWHWEPPPHASRSPDASTARFIARSSFWVIRIQVAALYLEAAVAKFRVPEWVDGTALYYWFTHPEFGAGPALQPVLVPIIRAPVGVTMLTWGTLALELFLFAGLTMRRRFRPWLLGAALLFHLGIAVVHGLVSFAIAMWAALLLYLWPMTVPILPRVREFMRVPRAAIANLQLLRAVGVAIGSDALQHAGLLKREL